MPIRTSLFLLNLVGLLLTAACGHSSVDALCETAATCELILEDEMSRCISDVEEAIDSGDVKRSEVRKCRRCVSGMGCGLDVVVGCAEECEGVGLYVTGEH